MMKTMTAFVAIAALSGIGSSAHAAASGPRPPALSRATKVDAPRLISGIPGLVLTRAERLPPAPASAASRDACSHLLTKPASPEGRAIANRGWAVTGEAQVGGYRAVSFVGEMEQGTSGSCRLEKGNIAFFQGQKLVALAWTRAGARQPVAKIEQYGPTGARLWDGDFLSQPFADIRADGKGAIVVGQMAILDPVCGGAAQMPNVYGIPIATARKLLQRQGWKPVFRNRNKSEIGYSIADLVQQGFKEVDDCSGTGFGFCRFDYAGPAGALGVTTVGDGDRPVAGYAVACRNRKKAA